MRSPEVEKDGHRHIFIRMRSETSQYDRIIRVEQDVDMKVDKIQIQGKGRLSDSAWTVKYLGHG